MKITRIIATALASLTLAGLGLSATAFGADIVTKAPKVAPAPEPSPWDFAAGGSLNSDYIFRGITQSAHKPSAWAYFEPRYNVTKDVQLYIGAGGESIDFPNHAAAEVDFYGGIRPTFGPVTFDLGFWYYWYPGGTTFNGLGPATTCTNLFFTPTGGCNTLKGDVSFWEVYGKVTWTATDQFAVGASVYYSDSVLNSGADGTYVEANAKYTFPTIPGMPSGWGLYVSGAVGHWFLGTSDQFYCTQGLVAPGVFGCVPPFPNGIPYKSYTTWNIGFAVTKSVFTVDFRYYDTNLNQGDCNAFTSDHTAIFNGSFTAINPSGVGSNWCKGTFVVTGKFDLTAMTNVK